MSIRFAPAVMSLFGLSLAWRTVPDLAGWSGPWGGLMSIGAVLIGLIILGSMTVPLASRGVLMQVLNDPQLKVLPACLTVSLMLLSALLAPHMPELAQILIWTASIAHFVLLIWLINGWFRGSNSLEAVSPVWFIPVVGNVVIPVGAMATNEVMLAWFGFSVGISLWLMLSPVVFLRLVHGKPMATEQEASQIILIAPPAIGSVSWSLIGAEMGPLPGIILMSVAFFLLLALLPLIWRIFSRSFVPANWAFGFPLAALSTCLAIHGVLLDREILMIASVSILLFVTVIVGWLLLGSARILVKT